MQITININKKIIILFSMFIISTLGLYLFSFLNGFFSFFIPFVLFGGILLFEKMNKKVKWIYRFFYFSFVSVVSIYIYLMLTLSNGTCQMGISQCRYGYLIEFKIDKLIKKDPYDIDLDWSPEDFLFGVYKNSKKQSRIK